MSDKKKKYKYCIVPACRSTTVKTPEKLFISLPRDLKLRKLWQTSMRRTTFVSDKGTHCCCEDHFDLENDLQNYMYLKVMKSGYVKLKPGVVPHIFKCQEKISTLQLRSLCVKRQAKNRLTSMEQENIANEVLLPKHKDEPIQANIIEFKSSNGVQCNISDTRELKRKETSYPSLSDSSFSRSVNHNEKEYIEKRAISIIETKPKVYIGIPNQSMCIVHMLCAKCNLPRLDVLITLKKLKLNLSYQILADDFGISVSEICNKIQNALSKLAVLLRQFVHWQSTEYIKKILPVPVRRRYKNVHCIIDCFEVSIQKPSDPILQSFTWSEYKGCNTIKYLIGCTADGFISFISSGFGGSITDKMIVEESNFLNLIEPGTQIIGNRGFKHLEQLKAYNSALVKPPSVSAAQKCSKEQVKEAKRITSLRIHIERAISRVREYAILEQHSCIHSSFVKYLDLVAEIVCGLINIQNYIVK